MYRHAKCLLGSESRLLSFQNLWQQGKTNEKVTLTSRAFHNKMFALWSKRITELTGKDKFLTINSGIEAVETSI